MDIQSVLKELGLSEGEIKVYLALLKLGSCPVSKVKEETELHRTTIYDFVEKLLNKGLINYVVKNNVKYYNAAHPNKLLEYLKEKQNNLSQILPELVEISKFEKEEVSVEVYKGKEGMKTALLEGLRTKDEILGIGIDETMYKKNLPVFIEQYQRMLKEAGVHERMIIKNNPEYLFDQSNTHYKQIPASYFSPTFTVIYSDKVQFALWEPSVMSVIIKNQKLADAYRQHFENLWNQETTVYKGEEEIKQMFIHLLESAENKSEWLVFGVPPVHKGWHEFFIGTDPLLVKKQMYTKIIFDEGEKTLIDFYRKSLTTDVKILPKEYMSPSEVDIIGGKVALVLWEEEMAILIDNKKIAQSFSQYFEVLWKMAKK